MIMQEIEEKKFLLNYAKKVRLNAKISDIKILKWLNDYDILIIFKDGEKYIYDTYTDYYRFIKYNSQYLTKRQWRLEFKDRLQQLMDRKNITQMKLAKLTKTSQPMISKYVSGESIPSAYMMSKIIEALQCTIYDILIIPYILKNYCEESEKDV